MIQKPSGDVAYSVGTAHRTPSLPKGYRPDLASDPDAPALLRSDATVVARFSARDTTPEAIEREALEDLLLRAGRQSEVRPQGT